MSEAIEPAKPYIASSMKCRKGDEHSLSEKLQMSMSGSDLATDLSKRERRMAWKILFGVISESHLNILLYSKC